MELCFPDQPFRRINLHIISHSTLNNEIRKKINFVKRILNCVAYTASNFITSGMEVQTDDLGSDIFGIVRSTSTAPKTGSDSSRKWDLFLKAVS